MKQLFLLWLLALAMIGAKAQQKVQDGTGTPATPLPAAGSLLELQSNQAGLRLPQIALTNSTSWTPLLGSSSAATSVGMFVYNTATSNDVTSGIYYWDGAKWQRGSNGALNSNAFTAGTPTGTGTAGVIYTDTLAGSPTQGQQYIWNGTAYVGYSSPAATEWNLAGGTSDAGSNKTSAVSRTGAILVGSNTTSPSSPAAGVSVVTSNVNNVPGLVISNGTASTDKNLFLVPQVTSSGYNPLSIGGDRAIIWGPFDSNDGLVIGPWSSTAGHGIRIAPTGIVSATGYASRNGISGTSSGNAFNIQWTGANAHLWINVSDLGAITTTSDIRLKEDIHPLADDGLSRMMQLHPVSFKYKKTGDPMFSGSDVINEGFIADELQAVIPSAVNGKKDTLTRDGKIQPQTLNIAPIVSVLTKAMQELQAEVEKLKSKNTTLAAQNAEIRTAMAELRKEVNLLVVKKAAKDKVAWQ